MSETAAEILAKIFIDSIRKYSRADRLKALDVIYNSYCMWCGEDAPCQCSNDD